MSLTEDEEARRAYLTGAADQLKAALSAGNTGAIRDVIRNMRADGFRAEAGKLVRFLLATTGEGPAPLAAVAHPPEGFDFLRETTGLHPAGMTCAFCDPPETATEPGE